MPKRLPVLLAISLLLTPGCAALVATTTETAKVVGKTTYKAAEVTAKAVTWPVREAVKMHQDAHKPAKTPEVVTTHQGRSDASTTRAAKTTDGDIKLAKASEPDEEDAPPRPRKKSSTTAKAKPEPDDLDTEEPPPKPRKSKKSATPPLDDEAPLDDAPASQKKPKWGTKKPSQADEADPDTIRIE